MSQDKSQNRTVSVALSQEFFDARANDLEARLAPSRFQHSLNVSRVAAELASIYDVNIEEASLAGLLHDWDKEYDDPGIWERVSELGLEVDPELMELPRLLHGPTAAVALARQFPEIPPTVLHAIEVHPTGTFDMNPLDICVYVADAIEPNRLGDDVERIRNLVGSASLHELFIETHGHFIVQTVRAGRKVYPRTLAVWNANSHIDGHYVKRYQSLQN